jgi:hypothetical protein
MADLPHYPDSNSDTGDGTRERPNRRSPPSTPRWVKVSAIIVVVLVLLFVILHLTGGGFGGHHGYTPPYSAIASVIEHGVQHL